MMNECVFCRIGSGEIKYRKFYESEFFYAILDLNPLMEGHALLIPKRHFQTIFEMTEEESRQMGQDLYKVSKLLENKFGSCMTLYNSSGRFASQGVPHFHVHLIPRKGGDRLWDGKDSRIVLDRNSGFERLKMGEESLKRLAESLASRSAGDNNEG